MLVKKMLRELATYSLPRLGGDFFLFAFSAFPVMYIGNIRGPELASYYSVGISIVTLFTPLFSFLGVILLPYVSRLISVNKFDNAKHMVNRLAIVYIVISIALTCLVYIGQGWLIPVFFAEKYIPAMECSQIVCLSILPQSLYLLYRNPNDAASKIPYNTLIMALSCFLLFLGFLFCYTLSEFATVYLITSFIQGFLSFCVWNYIIKKK